MVGTVTTAICALAFWSTSVQRAVSLALASGERTLAKSLT